MEHMTKSEEVSELRRWIASLPQNSYLAEWMRELAPAFIQGIQSDIIPSDTPTSIRTQVQERIQREEEERRTRIRESYAHEEQEAERLKKENEKAQATYDRMYQAAQEIRAAIRRAEYALENL